MPIHAHKIVMTSKGTAEDPTKKKHPNYQRGTLNIAQVSASANTSVVTTVAAYDVTDIARVHRDEDDWTDSYTNSPLDNPTTTMSIDLRR